MRRRTRRATVCHAAGVCCAGAVPLAPSSLRTGGPQLAGSIALTFLMLFIVGALRAVVTVDRWWMAGLEMLGLGAAVAVVAYGSGYIVARAIGT